MGAYAQQRQPPVTPSGADFTRRLFGTEPSRRTISRFAERPELEHLLAWAADDDPAAPVIKLILGESGSGKTRLAAELTARLRALGWIAGVLTADDAGRLAVIAEALPEILGYRHRVFIAIDDPEGLGDELTVFLSQLPGPEQGVVRVLLLAQLGQAGQVIRGLRVHADADPAGKNTELLLQAGMAYVSAYQALGRHAEAAQAMIEVLADCRRPLPDESGERLNCIAMAVEVMDQLPRPTFLNESLQIALEMSRTCRALPGDLPESQAGVAAAVRLIARFLREGIGSGLPDDEKKTAAREISAGARFLADHAPVLLDSKHAEAFTLAATILAASDVDQALDLNTQAIELRQQLAADHGDGPEQDLGILTLQGLILFGKGQYPAAVEPLEQALPILLAFGQDITPDQAQLLQMTYSLLSEAYRILNRDTAMRAMTDTVNASGVPGVVPEQGSSESPGP
jgi:tetratricopeptide (TPR) repeat protein